MIKRTILLNCDDCRREAKTEEILHGNGWQIRMPEGWLRQRTWPEWRSPVLCWCPHHAAAHPQPSY